MRHTYREQHTLFYVVVFLEGYLMNQFRKLLIGAALALGFVGMIAQPETAVAGKPFQNQGKILWYRNAFAKTERFIIFNGGQITAFTDNPLTQQGTIDFTFFASDTSVDYQAMINGKKVKIIAVAP